MNAYDLVVVGGGLAGFSAGIRAVELGLKTVIFETGMGESYPCTTRTSLGELHLGPENLFAEPDRIVAGLQKSLFGQADPVIGASLARNAGRARAWLQRQGGTYVSHPKAGPVDTGSLLDVIAPIKVAEDSGDWHGSGPDLLLQSMMKRYIELGGVLRQGCEVVGALGASGQIAGVKVGRSGADAEEVRAKAVVLASGGFQNHPTYLRRYVNDRPERLVQRNVGTGSGVSLAIAEHCGAKLVNLQLFYGRLVSKDALHNSALRLFPRLSSLAEICVAVDDNGMPVLNVGNGDWDLANRVARTQSGTAFLVFDSRAWDRPEAAGPGGKLPNPTLVERGGTLFRGGSIEAMAVAARLPPERLKEALDTLNGHVRRKEYDELPALRGGRKNLGIQPLEVAPFFAMPVVPAISSTYGGPLINDSAQVIGQDDRPIRGLYAAGDAAAGLEGNEPKIVGYGGGLAKALITGLLAAEHAASTVRVR